MFGPTCLRSSALRARSAGICVSLAAQRMHGWVAHSVGEHWHRPCRLSFVWLRRAPDRRALAPSLLPCVCMVAPRAKSASACASPASLQKGAYAAFQVSTCASLAALRMHACVARQGDLPQRLCAWLRRLWLAARLVCRRWGRRLHLKPTRQSPDSDLARMVVVWIAVSSAERSVSITCAQRLFPLG